MHPPKDMPENYAKPLHELEAKCNALVEEFAKTITKEPPPPLIYHYTDDKGLRGILESGCIWLTNIFDLNDPSELRHGLALASKILSEKSKNSTPEGKLLASLFTDYVTTGVKDSAKYFTCSFRLWTHKT